MDDFGNGLYLAFEDIEGGWIGRIEFDVIAWRVLYFFGMQYGDSIYDREIFTAIDNVV